MVAVTSSSTSAVSWAEVVIGMGGTFISGLWRTWRIPPSLTALVLVWLMEEKFGMSDNMSPSLELLGVEDGCLTLGVCNCWKC